MVDDAIDFIEQVALAIYAVVSPRQSTIPANEQYGDGGEVTVERRLLHRSDAHENHAERDQEERVRADHPLRAIKALAAQAWERMTPSRRRRNIHGAKHA